LTASLRTAAPLVYRVGLTARGTFAGNRRCFSIAACATVRAATPHAQLILRLFRLRGRRPCCTRISGLLEKEPSYPLRYPHHLHQRSEALRLTLPARRGEWFRSFAVTFGGRWMDRARRELQHIALPTAASIVHIQVSGYPPDVTKAAEMREVLNEVAHAISNVVPIYASDPTTGLPIELPPAELLNAVFTRGAHLLTTKSGKEYRVLTVQRRDMDAAIVVLKRIHFSVKPHSGAAGDPSS
jgi:hypothetical protein